MSDLRPLPSAICHLRISASAGLCLFTVLACAGAAPVQGATEGERALARFPLRDYLNRDWHNELVTFKVDSKLRGRRDLVLLDGDQHPVPFQWQTGTNAGIAFLASVPPFAQIEYRLVKGQRSEVSGQRPEVRGQWSVVSSQWSEDAGLTIKDQPDSMELGNEQIAIRLNRGTKGLTEGPIGGVRLTSGKWVGAGELRWSSGTAALEGCRVKVVADGPVFADVESEYRLADNGYWRLRFRVIAGEPVVLIDESFSGPAGAVYRFKLGAGWEPDRLFWRKEQAGATNALKDWSGENIFLLEPWLEWWRSMCGNWLAAYREGGPDLLAVGLREPACWVEPGKTKWDTRVDVARAGLGLEFQLRGFQRKWMLMALPRDDALKPVKDAAPLPQQYLIKHSDVPLDQIKDYVMEWPDAGLAHPRLYISTAELARFRQYFKVDTKVLSGMRGTTPKQNPLDDYVAYTLATGDRELQQTLAQFAVAELQGCVDLFTRQVRHPTPGALPHQKYDKLAPTLNTLDTVLSPGVLPPGDRARVRAQLAYLGYALAAPSFHSPERGYSANPNMTTAVRCMSGLIACLIPDHPEAKAWAQLGIREMANELDTWTGPNGGWLEAPHYATVSLDALIALALALHCNSRDSSQPAEKLSRFPFFDCPIPLDSDLFRISDFGFRISGSPGLRQTPFTDTDWAHHPKLKAAVRWLACISTPRDSRLGGQRHLPEIGNTYTGERTCLPGWMARIWRDKDPAFASQMQWMWQEQGSFTKPGIGGLYPGLMGYSALMFDPSIPAEAPAWGSEWFPEAGAVFRAHFPGEHETYLHYIQGRLHQHYDYDEGSFILWGKGQPLCEDFGYYGRAPAADHSRVAYASDEGLGSEGKVREFVAGERLDYLHGERPNWHRQILFIKDRDPLGPNYFVIRDTLGNAHAQGVRALLPTPLRPGPDWRVWIATDTVPGSSAPPPISHLPSPISHSTPPASVRSASPRTLNSPPSAVVLRRTGQPSTINSSAPLRVPGRFGVDLVVYFTDTSSGTLSTEELSRTTGASGFKSPVTTQHSLHLRLGENATVMAVLYPVTRTQTTPKFTKLANGRAVKIESSYGTDYAFLGLDPFDFSQGDLSFRGQTGAVQLRPDGPHPSLSGKGQVRYKGQVLTTDR
jgi:hypothetical protein